MMNEREANKKRKPILSLGQYENNPLPNNVKIEKESAEALIELGMVLAKIYQRMKDEGYDIIDNKIIHLSTGKEYEPKTYATSKRK